MAQKLLQKEKQNVPVNGKENGYPHVLAVYWYGAVIQHNTLAEMYLLNYR